MPRYRHRRSTGQFHSAWTDDQLREVVATVARAHDRRPLAHMSQPAFDAIRDRIAGRPCLTARSIVRRLDEPWEALVDTAYGRGRLTWPNTPARPRRRKAAWTYGECLLAVYRHGRWARGQREEERSFRRWAGEQPGRPWPQALARHGGLRALAPAAADLESQDGHLLELLAGAVDRRGDLVEAILLLAAQEPTTVTAIAEHTGATPRAARAAAREMRAARLLEATRPQVHVGPRLFARHLEFTLPPHLATRADRPELVVRVLEQHRSAA